MLTKQQILSELELFSLRTGGLGSWITEETDQEVFDRIGRVNESPITKVQLNQLLAFGHEAPVSDDFFRYYWLNVPPEHPYNVKSLPGFNSTWTDTAAITSLNQLKWGLYRIFTDGLLWFGNVRTAFRKLRSMNGDQLRSFFNERRFQTEIIRERGQLSPYRISLKTIGTSSLKWPVNLTANPDRPVT
jgi:hypothetical protein